MHFSAKGSKYFTLTALTKTRPFKTHNALTALKYNLWERGLEFEYFHATTDKQATRDEVFKIFSANISQFTIDSIIVEKRKTKPYLQNPSQFYRKIFEILLNYILERNKRKYAKIYIITDIIPINKKRNQIKN